MYVDGSLGEWLNLSTQGNALRQIYIDSFDYEIFYESRGLFFFHSLISNEITYIA